MEYTRINTQELKTALQKACEQLDAVEALLKPYLVLLTEAERKYVPRSREGFEKEEKGRAFAAEMAKHPKIAELARFESAAVVEDLDNVRELVTIENKVNAITQRILDSRLLWLGEAWVPSLTAYRVAKSLAKDDAELEALVAMLADLFATTRERKTEK